MTQTKKILNSTLIYLIGGGVCLATSFVVGTWWLVRDVNWMNLYFGIISLSVLMIFAYKYGYKIALHELKMKYFFYIFIAPSIFTAFLVFSTTLIIRL